VSTLLVKVVGVGVMERQQGRECELTYCCVVGVPVIRIHGAFLDWLLPS